MLPKPAVSTTLSVGRLLKREWKERIESGGQISGHADCRSVWPAPYVDELIVRQRDTSD